MVLTLIHHVEHEEYSDQVSPALPAQPLDHQPQSSSLYTCNQNNLLVIFQQQFQQLCKLKAFITTITTIIKAINQYILNF